MNSEVTGCILAGGRGQRMEGRDKGLIELAGRPLVAHVIDRLAPQVAQIVISANRELEFYRAFGYAVLPDRSGDFPGPLAGVEQALQACQTAYLVSVPCDVPLLPLNLVNRLHEAVRSGSARVAVAAVEGRWQNVVALWDRNCLDPLREFLESGARRVEEFLKAQRAMAVDFSADAATFDNVNTPEDLARIAQRLKQSQSP